jgi:hypothetical protein
MLRNCVQYFPSLSSREGLLHLGSLVIPAVTFGLLLLIQGIAAAQHDEELLPLAQGRELFNGQDLQGWIFFSKDEDAQVEDIWSVQDGVLKCTGKPRGYLQTRRWYRDYELSLQWRWSGKKGGNNGVLVHATVPLMFGGWPQSLEVQLQSGAAGDFWVIGKHVEIDVPNADTRRMKKVNGNKHQHRRIKRLESDPEKAVGQWNTMRIICDGDEITVVVNDVTVNHGTHCTVTQGAIALQSEGTPAEFRNISIQPLKK